jgi:hypothetical protein
MITFKYVTLSMVLGASLTMSLLLGGLAWSELPNMKEALPPASRSQVNTDLQEILGWMKHLNLSQTAKTSSDQSFERFLDLKSQGDAPVHMLEKATAFKQGARQTLGKTAAPRQSHHRSF